MTREQRKITYYFEKGKHNTRETLELSKLRAEELGINQITIATSHAFTPLLAAEIFKDSDIELIAVGLSASFREYGWDLTDAETKEITDRGIKVCKGIHAFSAGVDEAFLKGKTINRIVGDVLGIISQGTKVCIETAIMAAEAGLIPIDKEIIAVAGTDGGADTAIVIKPNYARFFRKIQILEFLCKPRTPFI